MVEPWESNHEMNETKWHLLVNKGDKHMEQAHICKIIRKVEAAPGVMDFTVQNAALSAAAKPGQFIHVKCSDDVALPLRRPISICDTEGDTLRFLFQIKGKGTAALAKQEGELDILGPLGTGFLVDNERFHNPAVIGGGLGTYPLLMLAKQLENPRVFLGFRTKELVTLEQEFAAEDPQLAICTDDGSYGYKCLATAPLEMALKAGQVDVIYTCGPLPMLKVVKELSERYGVKCQISMEQRMGCGIGACLTCTCETKGEGTWKHKRVCKNGPVFWADDLVL